MRAETQGTLLLTGATGFVGMEMLARYLQRTERRVCALVRADGWEQAAERVEATLTTLFGRRARLFGAGARRPRGHRAPRRSGSRRRTATGSPPR